jgi:hypothetical protein
MGRPYEPETNPPGRARPAPVRQPGSWGRDPDFPDADNAWVAERILTDLCLTFLAAREKIGPLMKQVRTDRGQTLEDVASQTGVSVPLLSLLETGKGQPGPKATIGIAAWVMRTKLPGGRISDGS